MKEKDLLELRKMRQEIALIREQKDHIGHSLEWYKQSAEAIEKHYQQLTNWLAWNEKRMKETEKRIEKFVALYDMAGCSYHRCYEIKFKKEMKYIPWNNEKCQGDEYYCHDEHYEKQAEFFSHYGRK